MAEPLYLVHENHLGEKRYQPAIPSVGYRTARLWREGDEYSTWRVWHYGDGERDEAVLYRSHRKAERVARKELRRRARKERNTFKGVSGD